MAIKYRTSIQPVFITVDDLNIHGAESRGSSNKIFTHFSYTWIDREDWIPYLGIGAYAEFGNTSHEDNNEASDCDHGISCALSKWGIWLKVAYLLIRLSYIINPILHILNGVHKDFS